MRAINKADAHKARLCAENIGVNLIQRVPALIVIGIAGRTREHGVGHTVTAERSQHFFRAFVADFLQSCKIRRNFALGFTAERIRLF